MADGGHSSNASNALALLGLQLGWARRLPIFLQTEATECGLACLAMIAKYYGHDVDLVGLRQRHPTNARGVTLPHLMKLAGYLQLTARPLRLDLEHIGSLRLPCILHWDLKHFVVLERVGRRHAVVHDPAQGVRKIVWRKTLAQQICFSCLLLLCGCHAQHHDTDNRGISEYKAIVPFDAPRYQVQPDERVIQPELDVRESPVYPKELIREHLGPINLTAQVVVDEGGRVERVMFPEGDVYPHVDAFKEAVRKSVLRWVYRPLVFTRTVKSASGQVSTTASSRPFSLWYNFHFEVVDGHGVGSFLKK